MNVDLKSLFHPVSLLCVWLGKIHMDHRQDRAISVLFQSSSFINNLRSHSHLLHFPACHISLHQDLTENITFLYCVQRCIRK